MSISINWGTKVITIPQTYLTFVSGSTYKMDVNQFRLDLKDLEDSEEGMPFPDTHSHNTEVSIGGVTLAHVVEIINGYTITFEDGQYIIDLYGANHNLVAVANLNQVSLRSSNSAGLITVTSGSGVTEQDKLDIADRVWDEDVVNHDDLGSFGEAIEDIHQEAVGKWEFNPTTKTLTVYERDGSSSRIVIEMQDENGVPTLEGIYKRIPQ